jgi:flagellar protein FlaG
VPSKPQAIQEKPRAAKAADPAPKGPENRRTEESAKALDTAVQDVKAYLREFQSDLLFQVDESTGHTFFKVVDAKTQEVIRQVPSEEILAMARKLRELASPKEASGVLVDKEG